MGSLGDVEGYLVDVELHHVGIRMRQCERRADTSRRADRTEEIGVLIALVSGLARPRTPLRPLADEAILLTNPRLILT